MSKKTAWPRRVVVLGGGLWGSVLAQQLAQARPRRRVVLWEFFEPLARGLQRTRRHPHIPGFRAAAGVEATHELAPAVAGAELLVVVLPSAFVRSTAAAAARALGSERPVIVNASKGIEPGSLATLGEVLDEELPNSGVYALSGPSFAREVARGVPTKVVLAGAPGPRADALRRLFHGGALSVVSSRDRKGVELGGSLKNVLAIGAGILDGLKAGHNTRAALLTEGMAEMGELIRRCGGRAETIYGLAGLGDLLLTSTSGESRNHTFGEKLGAGLTPAQAKKAIPTVVEGVEAAASARALARRLKVRVPVIEAVHDVVHRGRPARLVLAALGFDSF
jgi:glycerol-3-phosphate dehydrogenase (NAD(P)+)